MLVGSLYLGASDSLCNGSVAVSNFPNLTDMKEAVFEAPKSAAALDLPSPCETEGRFEECVGDCGEEGLRVEGGVWRMDGGWLDGCCGIMWDALGILSAEEEAFSDRDVTDEDGVCVKVWFRTGLVFWVWVGAGLWYVVSGKF